MSPSHITIVLKFGGTSVADAASWRRIHTIVQSRCATAERVVLVVSALSQVSNTIEQLLREARQGFPQTRFAQLRARHQRLATDLGVTQLDAIELEWQRLQALLTSICGQRAQIAPSLWAQAMSCGEVIASRLGYCFLQRQGLALSWLSATDLLLASDDSYLDSDCRFSPRPTAQAQLTRASLCITQGFIARNSAGETVLLGRGGSDTSATLLAGGLGAQRCEIWSDVPGFYSTDPRHIPQAKLIKTLSCAEAQEIALMGAKVLHPRAIAPLVTAGVELQLCSLQNPEVQGTRVSSRPATEACMVKAVTVKNNVLMLHMESLKMWRRAGFLADIFNCFKQHRFSVDLISTSEASVSVTLDKITAERESELEALLTALQKFCTITKVPHCATLSVIGRNIRSILHELSPLFALFERQTVHLVAQAANDLNLTFVVAQEQSERLLHKMHQLLFGGATTAEVFGDSWLKLQETSTVALPPRPTPWWRQQRAELMQLAAQHNAALYVYSLAAVDEAVQKLRALGSVMRIFYAMKANHNKALLEFLAAHKVDFECVSQEEIQHLVQALPQLDMARVLFTPNFCARHEYEFAVARGCMVTIDNLYVLEQWGEVFAEREVILRIDPGFSKGHHRHVMTGGVRSKFGISPRDYERMRAATRRHGIIVKGLHSHSGSGILAPHEWQGRAEALAELAAEFVQVEVLNLGGGFGVPEHPQERELDCAALDTSLQAIAKRYELWIEPGRYLTAAAGVLLAQVTQLKYKEQVNFVGVNTGMNSLLRPALYDAYHEIFNLTRLEEEDASEAVEVVGPICESADNFGHARLLPPCQEGDLLLINNVGAYGAVMASYYNLRPPATEVVL